jgi:hypothetical protein
MPELEEADCPFVGSDVHEATVWEVLEIVWVTFVFV